MCILCTQLSLIHILSRAENADELFEAASNSRLRVQTELEQDSQEIAQLDSRSNEVYTDLLQVTAEITELEQQLQQARQRQQSLAAERDTLNEERQARRQKNQVSVLRCVCMYVCVCVCFGF